MVSLKAFLRKQVFDKKPLSTRLAFKLTTKKVFFIFFIIILLVLIDNRGLFIDPMGWLLDKVISKLIGISIAYLYEKINKNK